MELADAELGRVLSLRAASNRRQSGSEIQDERQSNCVSSVPDSFDFSACPWWLCPGSRRRCCRTGGAAGYSNQRASRPTGTRADAAIFASSRSTGATGDAECLDPGAASWKARFARTDKPHLYPRSGKYAAGPSVTIQDSIPKAAIFYTTDGSQPTTSSKVYSGPIVLASSVRLRAIAKSPIYSASGVATVKNVIQ